MKLHYSIFEFSLIRKRLIKIREKEKKLNIWKWDWIYYQKNVKYRWRIKKMNLLFKFCFVKILEIKRQNKLFVKPEKNLFVFPEVPIEMRADGQLNQSIRSPSTGRKCPPDKSRRNNRSIERNVFFYFSVFLEMPNVATYLSSPPHVCFSTHLVFFSVDAAISQRIFLTNIISTKTMLPIIMGNEQLIETIWLT